MNKTSSRTKEWSLDRETFETLLAWLSPDRDQAGGRYETIRGRLIRVFASRGLPDAEQLADVTINRVARKVPEIRSYYEGDPVHYFLGVARKVILEQNRVPPPAQAPPADDPPEIKEREFVCLERCLDTLTPRNRDLVVGYYEEEGRTKIENRKALAERLGIGLNALRIRALRLRVALLECINQCLEQAPE